MDAVGAEEFPWPGVGTQDRRLRGLLERTEAAHRETAARLRAAGDADAARQVERFAAWVRFDLDEPQAARRLYAAAAELRRTPRRDSLPGKVLGGAMSLAGADRGNIQLLDPATGSLAIAAQHGFGAEFLEYFAVVDDAHSACGRAAKSRAQTVVADVSTDAGFAPHRDIAAASGFRAVQSTPLIGVDGRLIGVVSTHYRRPHRPAERDLRLMKRYGELAARFMASHLTAATGPAVAGNGEVRRRVPR